MQPSAYPIPLDVPGRLWIMPKPSSEWLADDIASYRGMGMDKIVSLLTSEEAVELGLAEEAALCRAAGLAFQRYPIPDRGLPREAAAFMRLAADVLGEGLSGGGVGLHCRAGIGRSGMLACAVLILQGLTAEDAIARVSAARGVRVPDTNAQAAYIAGIAAAAPHPSSASLHGTSAC